MINQLLKNKTSNIFIQLFRYTIVGGIAFIFDFGTLYILTEFFNVYYLFSAGVAFLLGLSVNYLLSIIWVFEKHRVKSRYFEFIVFSLIGVVGLALNEFFIWFFTETIGFYYLLSKILSVVFVYLWNFFIRKFTLFR